ncbi:MAG: glycosyltransferase [Saprospiraceae bacterium]|jgi:uncharacterized protein (TIGR00661 family)|nr:glycosyltransferase [Saprospiraceae bacterium]
MNEFSTEAQKILKNYFQNEDIVIVAALNWGLGHASRCVPVIHWLTQHCAQVIVASDGESLELLKKEFPQLTFESCPGYNIRYKYENIVVNMLMALPSMIRAISKEKSKVKKLSQKYNANVILSDNRLGCRTKNLRNYYITHQINIPHTNKLIASLGSALHQWYIRKFDTCFVPDYKGKRAICPALSFGKNLKAEYLGPLTRIRHLNLPKTTDICIVLSGPEPQRSKIETLLVPVLNLMTSFKISFVRGTINKYLGVRFEDHILCSDVMTSLQIESLLNTSKLLISRSGYSTIMDIHHLDIKAILIPTPGQTEQEYIADVIKNDSKYYIINQNETKKLPEIIQSMIKS